MKKSTRRALTALLGVVFAVSAGMSVWQLIQYRQEAIDHEEAAGLVELPDFTQMEPLPPDEPQPEPVLPKDPQPSASQSGSSSQEEPGASSEEPATPEPPKEEKTKPVYVDPYAKALQNMDFSALQKVNKDVKGWILIPDSKISYPILQGEDNDYYLKHNWKKRRNSSGSVFIDYRCSGDFSQFNTILYGHRMNNKSMFGLLWNYQKQSYYEKHPYVYISDETGSHKFEVFAAYEVPITKRTYQIDFESDQQKELFIEFCTGQSVIETGIVPTVNDKVITMSTCTGNGHETRWVVQAVLRAQLPKEEPSAEAPPAEAPTTEVPPVEVPPVEAPAVEVPPTDLPVQEPTETPEGPAEGEPTQPGGEDSAPEVPAPEEAGNIPAAGEPATV